MPDPAISTPSGKSPASPCSSSIRNTSPSTPPGISTPSSATTTGVGVRARRLSMRQVHQAGEKLFVDYAGQKPTMADPDT